MRKFLTATCLFGLGLLAGCAGVSGDATAQAAYPALPAPPMVYADARPAVALDSATRQPSTPPPSAEAR